MKKLILSELRLEDLKGIIKLKEGKIAAYQWTEIDQINLTEREARQMQEIKGNLLNRDTILMNEATIWARAIYPMLLL